MTSVPAGHHTTVVELLEQARSRLERLDPHEASRAIAEGALLVDIRTESQIAGDGIVPGARIISRNVLEWRCDPASPSRDEQVQPDRQIVVMCDEGYQSSLAAAILRDMGLDATDLAGGFRAWRAARLPIERAALPR